MSKTTDKMEAASGSLFYFVFTYEMLFSFFLNYFSLNILSTDFSSFS